MSVLWALERNARSESMSVGPGCGRCCLVSHILTDFLPTCSISYTEKRVDVWTRIVDFSVQSHQPCILDCEVHVCMSAFERSPLLLCNVPLYLWLSSLF